MNSVHPGVVSTGMMAGFFEKAMRGMPEAIVKPFIRFVKSLAWDPKDAALSQVALAISNKILTKKVTGKYFHPIARETLPAQQYATNKTLQEVRFNFHVIDDCYHRMSEDILISMYIFFCHLRHVLILINNRGFGNFRKLF